MSFQNTNTMNVNFKLIPTSVHYFIYLFIASNIAN